MLPGAVTQSSYLSTGVSTEISISLRIAGCHAPPQARVEHLPDVRTIRCLEFRWGLRTGTCPWMGLGGRRGERSPPTPHPPGLIWPDRCWTPAGTETGWRWFRRSSVRWLLKRALNRTSLLPELQSRLSLGVIRPNRSSNCL